MRGTQKLTLIALLALIGAAAVGLILTGGSPRTSGRTTNGQTSLDASGPVNQQYLDTARRLSTLAATPEEQRLARDAVHVADHELDMAFAAALWTTSHQPAPQTPRTRAIKERIARLGNAIQANQDETQQLTEAAKKAKGDRQEGLRQQIRVAQAKLSLLQDILADAKGDLVRAGGDPHATIQEVLDEHEAAEHANTAAPLAPNNAPPVAFSSSSLAGQWRGWSAIREKRDQLLRAQQDAATTAAALARDHDELERKVQKDPSQNKVFGEGPVSPVESGNQASPEETGSKPAVHGALSALHHLSEDQKNLAMLSSRIQDFEALTSTYDQWIEVVKAKERSALHDVIESALWIALLLLLAFFLSRLIDRVFARLRLEAKQRFTLRRVARLSVQAVAALAILFMTFGKPNQLSTMVGLAGAGLTVVLKDFIVSFLGWFVLMGRNGLRVGDCVEINGVRGEVIEIGLLRTILLETGNWTDAGQLTGRQVAFLNSFAVEGYYFNFSTSGQWLWDEVQVVIPASQNPYPLIERIRDIVTKETEGNAKLAEREWQRLTHRYGVRSFSAEPSVNVKPTDLGVHVIIRYITRADERSEVRYRMNHAMVKLLHRGGDVSPPAETLVAQPEPEPHGSQAG